MRREAFEIIRLGIDIELNAVYGDLLADGAKLGLEPERLAALEGLQDWLKHRHLLPADHEIDIWTDPTVLQAAKQNLSVEA